MVLGRSYELSMLSVEEFVAATFLTRGDRSEWGRRKYNPRIRIQEHDNEHSLGASMSMSLIESDMSTLL
jgi:hypothetical protein